MKDRSVIRYTLSHCVKCMKCIKACPTSALSMDHGRIVIEDALCTNCGTCVSTCLSKGLVVRGSSLSDLNYYDYTICFVPSALTSACSTLEAAQDLFSAIKRLGFDEVIDLSPVEGQIMKETQLLSDHFEDTTVIASFCPVINRLIKINYPMLLDELAPLEYPCEVMAKQIRKTHKEYGKVGIFNLCECEAKLAIAKYPYGNDRYEIDHALAIVDVFPDIRKNLHQGHIDVSFNREGLQACNPNAMLQKPEYLTADGFDKVNKILDLEEFKQLQTYRLLYLFPCYNGCIGGHLLWGNSFLTKNNIHELSKDSKKPCSTYSFDDLYSENVNVLEIEDQPSLMERMHFFTKVNTVLEELPGYDCSACGVQTCRMMAEQVVKGNKTIDDCHIIQAMKLKEGLDEHK